MNSIILIAIIVIIIAITGYFAIRIITNAPPATSITSDQEKIASALISSDVGTINKFENFVNTAPVIFYTSDDVKHNFNLFITTFYSDLNITEMNKLIDYYIHTDYKELEQNITIESIISNIETIEQNPINMFYYVYFLNEIKDVLILATSNKTDYICAGLGAMVLEQLDNNDDKIKSYYLDDYDKINDFIIYKVPFNFGYDKITPENTEIKDIYNDKYEIEPNITPPYKFSLNRYSKFSAKKYLNSSDPTEEQLNNFLTLIRNNKDLLIVYLRLLLIGPFIRLWFGTNINTDYDLKMDSNYARDLTTALNNINSDVKRYLPTLQTTIPEYIGLFNNTFKP